MGGKSGGGGGGGGGLDGQPDWEACGPAEARVGWVLCTQLGHVVVLDAVGKPRDVAGFPGEGFLVEAVVGDGSIEALSRQYLPTELAVVRHPLLSFVVPLHPNDSRLVGKEFRCLLWEPRYKDGSHQRILF